MQRSTGFCPVQNQIRTEQNPTLVMYHVSEFCELKGIGLAPWSEQTSESLHHDFNQVWENYEVKDTNHLEYGKRLLQAVQIYNSKHV